MSPKKHEVAVAGLTAAVVAVVAVGEAYGPRRRRDDAADPHTELPELASSLTEGSTMSAGGSGARGATGPVVGSSLSSLGR